VVFFEGRLGERVKGAYLKISRFFFSIVKYLDALFALFESLYFMMIELI
jgi:hypothetical protein